MKRILLAVALLSSQVALADRFGIPGNPGFSGRDGRSGRDGQSLTIDAQNAPMALDLSGTDGEDGTGGMPGENAFSCYQAMGNVDDLDIER